MAPEEEGRRAEWDRGGPGPALPVGFARPVSTAPQHHGFCEAYNAATENQRGNVIPVEITVYEDRSFTFTLKTPPAAKLLLKAAGVAKGSAEPHKTKVAKVTWDQVREIAETKKTDLNANDVDAAPRSSLRYRSGRWASLSNRALPVEGQLRPAE